MYTVSNSERSAGGEGGEGAKYDVCAYRIVRRLGVRVCGGDGGGGREITKTRLYFIRIYKRTAAAECTAKGERR